MGLFGKKKDGAPVQEAVNTATTIGQPPQYDISEKEEEEKVWVNLTDKMVRVELVGDEARLQNVEVKDADDRIRIVYQGILIAEVTKRGKAFKELEPYTGKMADSLWMSAKEGDYGLYYRTLLVFKHRTATITF